MGGKTIMARLVGRAKEKLKARQEETHDWDVPTEIYTPELETINTDLVTKSTVMVCPKCETRNHLTDGSCIRCDRHLL
jgi:hypothetical protein